MTLFFFISHAFPPVVNNAVTAGVSLWQLPSQGEESEEGGEVEEGPGLKEVAALPGHEGSATWYVTYGYPRVLGVVVVREECVWW